MQVNIILFISGGGSNARQIIAYFEGNERIQIVGVLSSKPNHAMEAFCSDHGVAFRNFQDQGFTSYLTFCKNNNVHWIVLAGFLKKIPLEFIAAYPNHIINIHPALLPGFGGAGMYGKFVHQAVFNSKAKFSGITIHLVNEEYDKGQLLYQHAVALSEEESPESIEQKVRSLELKHFAEDLESYIVK